MKNARTAMFILSILSLIPGCRHDSAVIHTDPATDSTNKDTVSMVFVGTYTRKEAHVDGKAIGIYLYQLNLKTGKMQHIGEVKTENPSYVAVDPVKRILYAVNELGSEKEFRGTVTSFRLNGTGNPELINTVSSGGNYPCYVSVDASGKWVMCANYGSGTLAVVPSDSGGMLGNPVSVIRHMGKGGDARQDGPHAHMIISSPDNRFIYACDLGTDEIYIYQMDPASGKLTEASKPYKTIPGAGPRHLAFHPALPVAYVVNELNGSVEVLAVDSLIGSLTRLQAVSTLQGIEAKEASCADIHLTPTGSFLYASNRSNVNNLAIFSVDPKTGQLTAAGHQELPGKTPRSFVIDPSGKYLLVAFQDTDNVVTYSISPDSGNLTLVAETHIPTPVCLKITEAWVR